MPDTDRRILKGHQARRAPRVPAPLALLTGFGLIAAGVRPGLVGAGILRPEFRVPAPVHGEAPDVDFGAPLLVPAYATRAAA